MAGRALPFTLGRFPYPRLVAVGIVGAALLAVAAALIAVGPAGGPGLGTIGARLAIIGYLLVVFAVSGLIALAVYERAR